MPDDEDLAYTDVFTLQREGASSEHLVEVLLERIGSLDPPWSRAELRSLIATSPTALEEARDLDRIRASDDHPVGPLHGIPVLVKDNIEVAGMPSSAGATALAGRPPLEDAPLVKRLRDAGAVILGTTNLSEWANIRSTRSTSGWSAVGGLCGNPWALDRNPGGSSSGSGAALAAGFAPLAVGTETDGSITCPSSLCGVAGIKPAVGSVSSKGIVPISSSQDSAGPMARTVEEVALGLEVLTGTAGIVERVRRGAAGLTVCVARTWTTGHAATDAIFDAALARLEAVGAVLRDAEPLTPTDEVHEDELTVMLCELLDGMAAYLPTRGSSGPQDLSEVIAHEVQNAEVELAHFGHEHFERAVELGGTRSDGYQAARERNLAWALGGCLLPTLGDGDVLVAPAWGPAWKSDLVAGDRFDLASPVTTAPSIAGWPIATAPMGYTCGLAVDFSAVGRPGSEALLLAVCQVIEQPRRPTWRPPERG